MVVAFLLKSFFPCRRGRKKEFIVNKAFGKPSEYPAFILLVLEQPEILAFIADVLTVIVPVHKAVIESFILEQARLHGNDGSARFQHAFKLLQIIPDEIVRYVMQKRDDENIIHRIVRRRNPFPVENDKAMSRIKTAGQQNPFL
nr:hypothetical protein [uncultured Paenibacillus sp.]